MISRQTKILLAGLVILTASSGCTLRCTEHGLCIGPLFRVRLERNRPGVRQHRMMHHGEVINGEECDCAHEGGVIQGEVISGENVITEAGTIIDGGTMVEGGVITEMSPGQIVESNLAARAMPEAPAANNPPANTNQATSTQAAKKTPASLNVIADINRMFSRVLKVDSSVEFAIYVENTGGEPISLSQLEGVFTENLKPTKVTRYEGPSASNLREVATAAQITGNTVRFDDVKNLGPDLKVEFRISVDVTKVGDGKGNFDLTVRSSALGMQPLKKNVPVTVTPK